MPKLFAQLEVFLDSEPHGAALNMAFDEVLLAEISRPLLRIYAWRERAVSFGYFEPFAAIEAAHPTRESVRRWTGGGVVQHGDDFTYSLIVPRAHPFALIKPLESYGQIHEAIALALRKTGMAAQLTKSAAPKISTACFENAAPSDVLSGRKKIAGAGQRRSRNGLLHQGSIQAPGLPPNFAEILSAELAETLTAFTPDQTLEKKALVVADQKYGSREWLEKF